MVVTKPFHLLFSSQIKDLFKVNTIISTGQCAALLYYLLFENIYAGRAKLAQVTCNTVYKYKLLNINSLLIELFTKINITFVV